MAELDNKANEQKAVTESTEISKLELIKLVVSEMKSMDKDALRSVFSSINEEEVEASLTKAEIARSIVESMKDMDRDQVSEIHEKVKDSDDEEEVEESQDMDHDKDGDGVDDKDSGKGPKGKTAEPKAKAVKESEESDDEEEDDEDDEEVEEGKLPPALQKAIDKKKGKDSDDEEEVEESAEDDVEDAMDANDSEKKKSEPKKAAEPKAGQKMEEVDIDDDIKAIAESLELSEENTEKAHTIFKAAVTSKVSQIKEELETQFEENLETSVKEIHEELAEAVDKYLTYCAEEWTKENELAIERGLRSEMTENFITGLKTLFTEHYVDIPDEKFSVMDELSNRLDEMETKLDNEVSKNMDMSEELTDLKRANVVRDACSDLTESQREKLASLAEGVDFKNEEDYAEKITEIKEAYFSVDSETIAEETVVEEGTGEFAEEDSTVVATPEMQRYLSAISNLKPL